MQLDHLVVMVRSLERSLPWYSAMLRAIGFEKTREHVWFNGTVAIDLKEAEAGTRDYERRGPGLHHLGLAVRDLDEALTHLRDEGVELIDETPRPGGGGHRVAFVHPRGTGGVLVELVEEPEQGGPRA